MHSAPRSLLSLFLFLLTVAGLSLPSTNLYGDAAKITYRGFSIDESRLRHEPGIEDIRKAIRQQIDIVLTVGLPSDIQEFLQSVPFVLIPADEIPKGTPGLYERGAKTVKVTSKITTTGNKPVLLHELLHAYHHQRIPQGFNNTAITDFFEKARKAGHFSEKSHMMQNANEFFACAATTYLFGETAQEPFTRVKIQESEPEYSAFLSTLFGKDAGKFAGKLEPGTERPKRRH